MTDKLRVRAYNVKFGDAILVTVPDRGPDGKVVQRRILIDFGNVLSGEGGEDAVFEPVIQNILGELKGDPLDLYVMTHEHMDHIQGLFYSEKKFFTGNENELRDRLKTRFAWLTASSAPDYYDNHPDAKEQHLQFRQAYEAIENYLSASPTEPSNIVGAMMLNNNPRKTADCVNYLQNLADATCYVYRGFDISGHHPFHEAAIEIWAPEEDTSEYYGRFTPAALSVTKPHGFNGTPDLPEIKPPPGVDAGAFYDLINMRRQYFDNLLAIDKSANNTSIVFCLEWRGWRLLFSGDAEERSWKTMDREEMLKPIHFLKVSHHGSHNGTPHAEMLDQILPDTPQDNKKRSALVSAFLGTYNNVPDEETLELVGKRCDKLVRVKDEAEVGGFIDLEFPAAA